jgi:hypothetical protein
VVVCPNCRQNNDEEAPACRHCGHSLEPGPSLMVSRRRDDAFSSSLEVPPPPRPRRWPAFVILGVLVAGGIAAWLFVALRPDPCNGTNFTSDRFGYCLSVPQGWQAQQASIGNVTVDQFSVPKEVGAVVVTAIDLPTGINLSAFTTFIRGQERQDGLHPGDTRPTTLGGTPARQWEIVSTGPTGQEFHSLEVVAVNHDFGWTVELADTDAGFAGHMPAFRQMLSSWRYK